MARKASSPASTALKELASLRAEVRSLGSALGRVITRLEGPETLARVEQLRRLAKAARAGDGAAAKELTVAVAALTPAEELMHLLRNPVTVRQVILLREILDRPVDAITAGLTSLRLVLTQPAVMLCWGALITTIVVLAMISRNPTWIRVNMPVSLGKPFYPGS
jgi:hypothetical protein